MCSDKFTWSNAFEGKVMWNHSEKSLMGVDMKIILYRFRVKLFSLAQIIFGGSYEFEKSCKFDDLTHAIDQSIMWCAS